MSVGRNDYPLDQCVLFPNLFSHHDFLYPILFLSVLSAIFEEGSFFVFICLKVALFYTHPSKPAL